MGTPRRTDLVLVGGAAILAAVLVLLDGQGWVEWLFGTFMLSCLGLVVRLGLAAWTSARAERLRASRLGATQPAMVAERAVALERSRLADEVEVRIRDALRQVAGELERLDGAAPVPALQRIHALTRRTTSELRRQLGLLRAPDVDAAPEPDGAASAPERLRAADTRRAVIVGLVVAGLAAVESTAYLMTEGPSERLPWSVLVSTLAAGTVTGRITRLTTAAVAFTCLVTAGSLAGYPVTGGFWIVITLGVLMWSLTATALTGRRDLLVRLLAAVAMVVVVSWSFGRDDPGNLGILLVVLGTAMAGGLLVARQRWGENKAMRIAETRERVLDEAADAAVRAERAVVARELHDVVSHAVGVIALQAGAAELSWPNDPATTRRAVEVIRRTTAHTLADLDRLSPTAAAPGHTVEDLLALVERVRLTGTPVDLTVVGDASAHADIVHRVVQESLTNAMRHAPGAPVSVRVHTSEDRTVVSVADRGPGPRQAVRPGYGLVGLAERVEFAHGSFESGPGPDGRGFRVVATIPRAQVVSTR